GRNPDARPAVAQDVDRQQRAPGNRIVVDSKVVVDSRQRRVNRRPCSRRRGRDRLLAQHAILVDRQHHPASGRGSGLSGGGERARTQAQYDDGHTESHTSPLASAAVKTPGSCKRTTCAKRWNTEEKRVDDTVSHPPRWSGFKNAKVTEI